MARVGLIDHVTIDTDGTVGSPIDVDATTTEDHTFEAEVSEYPIEDGSDIVDNVRIKPLTISLECIISDTPMDGVVKLDGNSPSTQAYLAIQKVFQSKQPVTFETSLDRFENMVITSLGVPRSADIGYSIQFKISAQQVIIITNERTTVNIPTRPSSAAAKITDGYQLVFSRPATSAERHKFSSEFGGPYGIAVTDKMPPTGIPDGQTWDHYDVLGNTTVVGVTPETKAVTNGLYTGLSDGWVTNDQVYHPYAKPSGENSQLASFAADVTGIHYDDKTKQWLGDDDKPIQQNPGPAANKLGQQAQAADPNTDFSKGVTQGWRSVTGF